MAKRKETPDISRAQAEADAKRFPGSTVVQARTLLAGQRVLSGFGVARLAEVTPRDGDEVLLAFEVEDAGAARRAGLASDAGTFRRIVPGRVWYVRLPPRLLTLDEVLLGAFNDPREGSTVNRAQIRVSEYREATGQPKWTQDEIGVRVAQAIGRMWHQEGKIAPVDRSRERFVAKNIAEADRLSDLYFEAVNAWNARGRRPPEPQTPPPPPTQSSVGMKPARTKKPGAKPARAKKPKPAAKPRRAYTDATLERGVRIELAEHAGIGEAEARRLARDHLDRDPKAYKGRRLPRPAGCRGSVRAEVAKAERLKRRTEQAIARRASDERTRHGRARERMLARHQRAADALAARFSGPDKAKGRVRVAVLRRRQAVELAALDRGHRERLRALPRQVECAVLGRAGATRAVSAGCGTLCGLNLDGGTGGDATTVALPSPRGTPRVLPARFVLTSAASLIASHDPQSFDVRADYPDRTQERRYERSPAEKLKVTDIAQNMQPGLIANTNAGAVDGTPIVDRGRIVLSGNGRTMGVQRHYLSGRRVLADYLARHAAQFGLDPAAVARYRDPIVVRVVDVAPADRPRLVRDFNVGLTQQLSEADEADALARQLPPDTAQILAQTLGGSTLAEYLGSRASLPLVGALERSGYVTRANRSRVLGEDGLLTASAREDVAALLAAAVLHRDLALRVPEAARAIDRSAPSWLVAAGAGPDWDVRADLAAAVEDLAGLRASRMCLSRWLQQVSLERPRTDGRPMGRLLLEILDLAADRPTVIAKVAAGYAEASRSGGGLFGGVQPLDALRAAASAAKIEPAKATSARRCRK